METWVWFHVGAQTQSWRFFLSRFLCPVLLSLPFPCCHPCMLLLWVWICFIYMLGRTDFSLPNFISYLLPCSERKSGTPQPYIINNGRALIILSGPFCLLIQKMVKFPSLANCAWDDHCSSNLSEGYLCFCGDCYLHIYFFFFFGLIPYVW